MKINWSADFGEETLIPDKSLGDKIPLSQIPEGGGTADKRKKSDPYQETGW